jgi:hypothetical protein
MRCVRSDYSRQRAHRDRKLLGIAQSSDRDLRLIDDMALEVLAVLMNGEQGQMKSVIGFDDNPYSHYGQCH